MRLFGHSVVGLWDPRWRPRLEVRLLCNGVTYSGEVWDYGLISGEVCGYVVVGHSLETSSRGIGWGVMVQGLGLMRRA